MLAQLHIHHPILHLAVIWLLYVELACGSRPHHHVVRLSAKLLGLLIHKHLLLHLLLVLLVVLHLLGMLLLKSSLHHVLLRVVLLLLLAVHLAHLLLLLVVLVLIGK